MIHRSSILVLALIIQFLAIIPKAVPQNASDSLNPIPQNVSCDLGPDALTSLFNTTIEHACITIDDATRCFYTYIPDCAEGSVPLVYDIHGVQSCPKYAANYTGWFQKASEECFVVVWPVGTTENVDMPCWTFPGGNTGLEPTPNERTRGCCCTRNNIPLADTGDLDFLRELASHVADHVSETSAAAIDPKRIYLSGHSNGCMASIAMAMRHSELIAAVCCVSASFITHPKFNYSPRPISLILGGLDSLVKPQGWFIPGYGLIFPSANSSFEALSELNQCTRDLFSEQLVPELDLPALKGGIQTRLSTGCKNNASIQFTTITTAGHMMFPNIMPELFPIGAINTTADTLDLTTMMWDSCRHHINPIDPFEVSMSPSLAPTPKPTFILTGMPTTSSASSLATGLCLSAMLGTWFGSIQ